MNDDSYYDDPQQEDEIRKRMRARLNETRAAASAATTAEATLPGQGVGASPSSTPSGEDEGGLSLGDVGTGALELGSQALGGAFDGLDSMFNIAHDLAEGTQFEDTFGEVDIFPNIAPLITEEQIAQESDPYKRAVLQEEMDNQVLNPTVGALTRGIAQFGIGVAPGIGFVKAAKYAAGGLKAYKAASAALGARGGTIATAAAWGAVTDFMAFDGNEGRISDILVEHGDDYPWMRNVITEGLSSEGDATWDDDMRKWVYEKEDGLEGRLKNTMEGAILGVALDGLVESIKYLRGSDKFLSKTKGNTISEIAPVKSAHSNLTRIGSDMNALDEWEKMLDSGQFEAEFGEQGLDLVAQQKWLEANPELKARVSTDLAEVKELRETLTQEHRALADAWTQQRTSPEAARYTDDAWESLDEGATAFLTSEQKEVIDAYKATPRAEREANLLASAQTKADEARYKELLREDAEIPDAAEVTIGAAKPKGFAGIDDQQFKTYADAVKTGNITEVKALMESGVRVPLVRGPQVRGGTIEDFLADMGSRAKAPLTLDDVKILRDETALKSAVGLDAKGVKERKGWTKELRAKNTTPERKVELQGFLDESETNARGYRTAGDDSLTDAQILKRAETEGKALAANSKYARQRWADFMSGKLDVREAPHMIHVARQIKSQIDVSILDYTVRYNRLGTLPVKDVAEFKELLHLSGRMHDAIQGHASQAGGLLRSLGKTPTEGLASDAWVKNLRAAEDGFVSEGGERMLKKQMALINAATDDMLGQTISDVTAPSWVDHALHYWTNSLLSGPQTLSIQPISAAMMTVYQPFEAAAGAAMRGDIRGAGHKLQGLYALIQSFRGSVKAVAGSADNVAGVVTPRSGADVLANGWQALKTAEGQIDSTTMVDEGVKALGQGAVDFTGLSTMDSLAKAWETVVGLPSRLIATADEVSKGLNYNVKLMQDGYADAAQQAARTGGPDIPSATAHATEYMNKVAHFGDITDPVEKTRFKKLHDEAIDYAKSATFQSDAKAGGMTQSVQGFVARHPMARIVMPFVRTPSNIIKYAWERTPVLARLSKADQEILRTGTAVQKAAIQDRRRVGTALWATAMLMGSEGRITGGAPREPGARDAWKNAGIPEYSMYVGEKDGQKQWISYKRSDPFGMFLGVSADLAGLFQEMDSDDASVMELAAAGMTAMIENVKSRSYVQGVSQLLQTIENPDRRMESYVGGLLQNAIPNVFAQTKRYGFGVEPDGMSEVRSIYDRMANRIPGVASALEPKLNMFGEPLLPEHGTGSIPALDLVNPFFSTKSDFGPAEIKALRQNKIKVADLSSPEARIAAVSLSIGFKMNMKTRFNDIGGVELEGPQRTKWIKGAGAGLKQELDALIKSPTWKYATNPQAGDEDKSGKYLLFKRTVDAYINRAKQDLIRNDDALWKRMQAKDAEARYMQSQRPDGSLAGR